MFGFKNREEARRAEEMKIFNEKLRIVKEKNVAIADAKELNRLEKIEREKKITPEMRKAAEIAKAKMDAAL